MSLTAFCWGATEMRMTGGTSECRLEPRANLRAMTPRVHPSSAMSLWIAVTCFCLVVTAGVSRPVQAAAGSIVVSPSKIQLKAEKSGTTSFTIELSNTANKPVRVYVRPWNFARDASGNIHEVSVEDEKSFLGCASWLTMDSNNELILQPNSSERLKFRVDIPSNIEDGTRYCYLDLRSTTAELQAADAEHGIAAPVVYSMNALLLVQVGAKGGARAPAYTQGISVQSFRVPRVSFSQEVKLNASVRNQGSVHANLAQGSGIQIWQGNELRGTIALKEYTLLPKNSVLIPAVWKSKAPIGKFKATFVGSIGAKEPIVAERTFWVVNPRFAGPIAAALLLFLAMVVTFMRRFKLRVSFAPRSEPQELAADQKPQNEPQEIQAKQRA